MVSAQQTPQRIGKAGLMSHNFGAAKTKKNTEGIMMKDHMHILDVLSEEGPVTGIHPQIRAHLLRPQG